MRRPAVVVVAADASVVVAVVAVVDAFVVAFVVVVVAFAVDVAAARPYSLRSPWTIDLCAWEGALIAETRLNWYEISCYDDIQTFDSEFFIYVYKNRKICFVLG